MTDAINGEVLSALSQWQGAVAIALVLAIGCIRGPVEQTLRRVLTRR